MALDPNLGFTIPVPGNTGVIQQINDALATLSGAIGGRVAKSVDGSSNVTLSTSEASNQVIELTGALTGNIDVLWPSSGTTGRNRVSWIYNATTGAFTLTFKYTGGTGVLIPQNYIVPVFHNGTNVYAAQHFMTPWTGTQSVPAVPAVRAYHSANQSISNNTLTAVALNSERYDTMGSHDTSTNNSRLTCKVAGLYTISFTGLFDTHATGWRLFSIRLNGTTTIADTRIGAIGVATIGTGQGLATQYFLALNDYVEACVLQDSGGALNLLAVGNYSPEFSMARIG